MSILEYSAEKHMQVIKDEGFELGLDQGIKGAVELLRETGLDDEIILEKICEK